MRYDLYSLPEEIENLVNLEVLRVRQCIDLSNFVGSVRNLNKLHVLEMVGCCDFKLPEDIGELSSLRKLDTRNRYVRSEEATTISIGS